MANLSDAPRFDVVYATVSLMIPPIRTTVGSVLNPVLVEIDVIAFVGAATSRTEREA